MRVTKARRVFSRFEIEIFYNFVRNSILSSLLRSAWECIQTFVNAPMLLHVIELGMHSHAERGNEKTLVKAPTLA